MSDLLDDSGFFGAAERGDGAEELKKTKRSRQLSNKRDRETNVL